MLSYRPPLPVQHPVFTKAESPSPLLLIGCQTWNDAAEKSYLKSDLEKEKAVMQAASRYLSSCNQTHCIMHPSHPDFKPHTHIEPCDH